MNTQKGFTLLEVMIAMVLIAVGLLGIAALQSHAMRAEMESYQRAQALIIADDMINRIDANRTAKQCYADTGVAVEVGYNQTVNPNCLNYGIPQTQAIANSDISHWDEVMRGTVGNAGVAPMVHAYGCITYDGIDSLTVSVFWQGLTKTIEHAAPADCKNIPDYQGMRRVVSRTIKLPVQD